MLHFNRDRHHILLADLLHGQIPMTILYIILYHHIALSEVWEKKCGDNVNDYRMGRTMACTNFDTWAMQTHRTLFLILYLVRDLLIASKVQQCKVTLSDINSTISINITGGIHTCWGETPHSVVLAELHATSLAAIMFCLLFFFYGNFGGGGLHTKNVFFVFIFFGNLLVISFLFVLYAHKESGIWPLPKDLFLRITNSVTPIKHYHMNSRFIAQPVVTASVPTPVL